MSVTITERVRSRPASQQFSEGTSSDQSRGGLVGIWFGLRVIPSDWRSKFMRLSTGRQHKQSSTHQTRSKQSSCSSSRSNHLVWISVHTDFSARESPLKICCSSVLICCSSVRALVLTSPVRKRLRRDKRMLRLLFRPPPLPLKLAFTISLAVSFSVSCCADTSPPSTHASSAKSRSPPPPSPKAVAADLLSVLAGPRAAARVPPAEASRLRACLRFLSPVNPAASKVSPWSDGGSRKFLREGRGAGAAETDEMVMWPPAPVMELARLAVDSGGDPGAIHRALDPTMLPVPDVEGTQKNKCQLTRTPYGRRFANKELNSYLAFLFELIVARGPSVGLNVSLSRYDLFHGHLFLSYETGRLGILFHAKEYPAIDEESFPYNLGYCQAGSNVPYDDSMNLRNILWLAPLPSKETKAWLAPGTLVVLDAHPDGIIYQEMIRDYVQIVRTVYEDDFGENAVDVNYLNVANSAPVDRIFIC